MNLACTDSEPTVKKKFHQGRKKRAIRFGVLACVALLTVGCASSPPRDPENICNIFEENRSWWRAAKSMNRNWDVPIHVPMAIMYQESSFQARARPPRRYVLGFIPWGRLSDAYGYAQAKTMTWDDYIKETGNRRARRDNFGDAIDFIGWYMNKTHTINGVSKHDAYNQYLNYHEGWGGFQRRTYAQKAWLIDVSRRVDARSNRYAHQLNECRDRLDRGWFRRLFFG